MPSKDFHRKTKTILGHLTCVCVVLVGYSSSSFYCLQSLVALYGWNRRKNGQQLRLAFKSSQSVHVFWLWQRKRAKVWFNSCLPNLNEKVTPNHTHTHTHIGCRTDSWFKFFEHWIGVNDVQCEERWTERLTLWSQLLAYLWTHTPTNTQPLLAAILFNRFAILLLLISKKQAFFDLYYFKCL